MANTSDFRAGTPIRLGQRPLRQEQLVLRHPALAHAHPGSLLAGVCRGAAGLALIGTFGAAVGEWLLTDTVRSSARFAAAFKIGAGSAVVAGLSFAVLGALGQVVFGDLVGDFRERRIRRVSALAALAERAVEFVGGATWGTVCGALIGVLAAAGCWAFAEVPSGLAAQLITGAGSGALLGAVLVLSGRYACVVREAENSGAYFAALGPFACIAKAFTKPACKKTPELCGGEPSPDPAETQRESSTQFANRRLSARGENLAD
jgi:hypothetical protein